MRKATASRIQFPFQHEMNVMFLRFASPLQSEVALVMPNSSKDLQNQQSNCLTINIGILTDTVIECNWGMQIFAAFRNLHGSDTGLQQDVMAIRENNLGHQPTALLQKPGSYLELYLYMQ